MPESQSTNKEDNKNVIAQVDHIKKDVHKIHSVGAPKYGKQARIVKFTTHNFKERIFLQHRQCKKSVKKDKRTPMIKLNIRPSPTCQRLALSNRVNGKIQDNDCIKFAFADMHGNLKLILNEPIDSKYVYGFKTEEDIDETLSLIPDYF